MDRLRLVGRLLRLVGGAASVSLQQELAHRTDLAVRTAMAALGVAGTAGALAAVYAHVERLAGWRFGEAIVLLGTFMVVNGLLQAFVEPNLVWFADRVRNGALDDVLLKPAPSIFMASLATCQPWALSDAALGAALAAAGLRALGADAAPVTAANVFACLLLVLVGAVIAWASRLLLASVAFWAPGLELSVLYSGVWQLGRYPVDVYGPRLRALLTYVVPVAYVSTFPARALTRGADPLALLGGLTAAAGAVWLAAAVWQGGLRRYTSATS